MHSVPINSLDTDTEVLIIRGPDNHITIGPIFQRFKRLEILRITDSLVPSVGTHSFWGVPSLTVLGEILICYFIQHLKLIAISPTDLSRNNITALVDNNFRGQENLQELDLSQNKIHSLISWVFHYLLVIYCFYSIHVLLL